MNRTVGIDTSKVIDKYKLFWQYPVITEEEFYNQNSNDSNYLGFPWATVIDKQYNLDIIYNILKSTLSDSDRSMRGLYTCCQHIYFKKLANLWNKLGIDIVYTPHKVLGEDKITLDGGNEIKLKSCPLYAVNYENGSLCRSNKDKNIKANFIGAYQSENYISDIRLKLFELNKGNGHNTGWGNLTEKEGGSILIINTGEWHFNKIVYSKTQNKNKEYPDTAGDNSIHRQKTEFYNNVLNNSVYTLSPSGAGPNSIRFWEALSVGSIPILLADTLELPTLPNNELNWDNAIIRVKESDVHKIPSIIYNINKEETKRKSIECMKIYDFLRNNYIAKKNINTPKCTEYIKNKNIIHYCCGSYDIGDFGGVARYDYQLKTVFPNRVFFRGPQQKNEMLSYLNKLNDPSNIIVFTDNHLACDIPNEFFVFLVHHGCARTTAKFNPDWEEPWKSLCCKGQDLMLDIRDPNNTQIITISQSCTDDFISYYGDKYNKFKRHKILHSSELDEVKDLPFHKDPPLRGDEHAVLDKEKNKIIKVLGNWNHIKKGKHIIPKIVDKETRFDMIQLSIFPTQSVSINDSDSKRNSNINKYNENKKQIYNMVDVFLQLSNSEGNSYATLDALACGIPVVSTKVGLFYKDVPNNCFVSLDTNKLKPGEEDINYILERLDYAYNNRKELSLNAKKWYTRTYSFSNWKYKMIELVMSYAGATGTTGKGTTFNSLISTTNTTGGIEKVYRDNFKGFFEIYNQTYYNNNGGMCSCDMFTLYLTLKILNPKIVIESGVWNGLSTKLIRETMGSSTIIICIDPREVPPEMNGGWRDTSKNTIYLTGNNFIDFGKIELNTLLRKLLPRAIYENIQIDKDVLVFFDDHQDSVNRLLQTINLGIKNILYNDNYPLGCGSHYSLEHFFKLDNRKFCKLLEYKYKDKRDYIKNSIDPDGYFIFPNILEGKIKTGEGYFHCDYAMIKPVWAETAGGDTNINNLSAMRPEGIVNEDKLKIFSIHREKYRWNTYIKLV